MVTGVQTCALPICIADSVVKRRFRRGEIVVEHNKKSNALFILLTGRAGAQDQDAGMGGRGRHDDAEVKWKG